MMTTQTTERALDRALDSTFPASDPVALPRDLVDRPDAAPVGAGSSRAAIAAELRALLADVLTLFIKTKSFHWHVSGPHFRDHHLLFDEQAEQLASMIDPIAERARKLGHPSLRSLQEATRLRRLSDDNRTALTANEMLLTLLTDNRALARSLQVAHDVCQSGQDVATASLLENWIDEAETRCWFLSETTSGDQLSGPHA